MYYPVMPSFLDFLNEITNISFSIVSFYVTARDIEVH